MLRTIRPYLIIAALMAVTGLLPVTSRPVTSKAWTLNTQSGEIPRKGPPPRPTPRTPEDVKAAAAERAYRERIKKSENPNAFRIYKDKFRNGAHIKAAQERLKALETAAWEKIKNNTNIEDFRQFLNRYPDGRFAREAENRIRTLKDAEDVADDLAWEKVESSKNQDDIRDDYLKKHPRGKYADLARELLRALEEEESDWGQIKNSDSEEDLTIFLIKHPNGKFADQAKRRRKDLKEKKNKEVVEWEPIKNSKDPTVYVIFLNVYPNGKFVKEAQSRLRDLAGTVKRNLMGMELVWIASGSFTMGSDTVSSDEKPMHRVTLNNGFYMGKYEVTIAEWREVMGDIPGGMKKDLDSKFKENERQPVVRVSWDDAQEFIRRLNARGDGYTYRLPTEAEWEYACRAGTAGDYAGDLNAMAWYSPNSGDQTHTVGQKRPNAFGLYDMHGNVWEWCEDWYHENYNGAPTDGSAWLSGGEQKNRGLRGGSWSYSAGDLRSAYRRKSEHTYFSVNIGFRVVAVARTQ